MGLMQLKSYLQIQRNLKASFVCVEIGNGQYKNVSNILKKTILKLNKY